MNWNLESIRTRRIGRYFLLLLLQLKIGEGKKDGSKKLAWSNLVVVGKLVEEGKLVGRENGEPEDREEVRRRVVHGGKREERRVRIRR